VKSRPFLPALSQAARTADAGQERAGAARFVAFAKAEKRSKNDPRNDPRNGLTYVAADPQADQMRG
jgi:hypothetical protein